VKTLGVCRASCVKPQKIADQAIFYLANSVRMPDNRGFYGFFNEKAIKTYKCNRLLAVPGDPLSDSRTLPLDPALYMVYH
jgi:hypothetical protein